MSYVSPGFPASGGDSAPMVIEPSGKIDVLYQGYHITNTTTYTMDPAYSYYISSTDHGATWSAPVRVGGSQPRRPQLGKRRRRQEQEVGHLRRHRHGPDSLNGRR